VFTSQVYEQVSSHVYKGKNLECPPLSSQQMKSQTKLPLLHDPIVEMNSTQPFVHGTC
jgi:hypothetical protein